MTIVLANAAFGDDPRTLAAAAPRRRRTSCGCAPSPPAARAATAAQSPTWRACPATRGGPLASLAHSTRASFLRQLGWHDRPAAGTAGRWPSPVPTRGGRRRTDRTGRRRARRWPVRGVRRRRCGVPASCSPDRCRRGCRCGWRGCPPELAMASGDGAAAVRPRRTRRRTGGRVRLGATRRQIGRGSRRGAVQHG